MCTIQVMQFAPSSDPTDGPGALRMVFQEELQDQFVFFGLLPVGLYTLRTDPGTVLNTIRTNLRRLVARALTASAAAVERAYEVVRRMRQ